jgi:hypothetical protein
MNLKKVKHDSLDTMWAFLQMGGQNADHRDVENLMENCAWMVKAMTQKTAGQRQNKQSGVDWAELEMRENLIVLWALTLYLSGWLDKLKEIMKGE